MAVTIHNTTVTSGPASATSRVLLHTATAGSVLLVWNWTNEANSLSAVAAAGEPMTRLGAVSAGTSFLELWGLTSPASGILTISAIGVGTQGNLRGLIATSYVGQRTIGGSPFGTVVGGTAGAATTANLSISATTTDIVAFGFAISSGVALVLNNGTTRGSATLSTVGRMVVGDIAGAAAVSVSATAGGTVQWGMIGVPVVASIAAITSLAFDVARGTATSGNVTNISLLLTATTNAVLLVFTTAGGGSQSMSAINAGAGALTRLGFVDFRTASPMRAEVWGLTSPASGVLTISAHPTNAGAFAMAAITYVGHYTGVGGPFGGVAAGSADAVSSGALVVSSTLGNVVVFGVNNSFLTPSVGSGLVNRIGPQATFPLLTLADTPGITSATCSAAVSGNTSAWGFLGVNLIQAGGLANRTASMSATDAQDVFAAPGGKVIVSGRLSATDAQDVFAATLKNRVSGFLSATDVGADTFAATAKNRVTGLLSATDVGVDTFAATVQNRVSGRLSATDAQDTFAATAFNRISGRLSATDAADTFAATGYVVIQGRLSATDAPDIFLAQSTPPNRSATVAFTDPADTFAATAQIIVTGLLSATDAPDIFLATSGLANRSATVAFTDPADTFAATAFNRVTGSLAATDTPDTFAASATVLAISAPAAPAIIVTDSSAGHGDKRNNKKPPYIRAPDDFWKARERYLLSLQPEIDAEPEVIIEEIFPESNVTAEPAQFDPLLLISYRQERSDVIAAIPTATTMRSLRSYGDRLRLINDHILRQKRLELIAAQSELAAIQAKLAHRRKVRNLRISRLRKIHATLEIAHSLTHFYAHH